MRRTTFLAAVVLVASAARPSPAAGPERVALVVGVDLYKSRILVDKPLRYAERDATDLGAVLKAQGFLVKLLTGPRATSGAVDAALREILDGRGTTDLVLVAFSGHGVQMPLLDEKGRPVLDDRRRALSEAYFCPSNAVLGRPDTMVSLTRLVERLDREGGVNMMLVDACRDDPEEARKKGLRSLSGDELVGRMPNNSVILFSCSAGQRALETERAGGGHGVFFHHVIEGLRGRAADPESDEVSWDDLARFVRKNVNPRAREWDPEGARSADVHTPGQLQNPHMLGNLIDNPVLSRVVVPRPAPDGPAQVADVLTSKATGLKLKLIPAGSFLMGSSKDDDKDAKDDETPRHRVRITRPFYLGVTEVTVGQFRKVVESSGYKTEAESDSKGGYGWDERKGEFTRDPKYTWRDPGFLQSDEHPVTVVSWKDAVAFCDQLSIVEGLKPYHRSGVGEQPVGDGYRLPTEAEWEYACRAGTTSRYQGGDDPETLAAVGNVTDATLKEKGGVFSTYKAITGRDGYLFTAPVGRFRSNAWGLFDMHGNVWEWCKDGYKADYYKGPPDADPTGPPQATERVIRGGGWGNDSLYVRSAFRHSSAPDYRSLSLGFRVARDRSGR